MSVFRLEPVKGRASRKGDFSASVRGDALELPADVWDAAQALSIRNAPEFVAYLHGFPSALATRLNWSPDDVVKARDSLVGQLRGQLPDAILEPPIPDNRVLGAFPPTSAGKD